MTREDEDLSLETVERCRRINRMAAARYVEHGADPTDVAIAAVYAAHDLAMHAGHDPHAAIEWLRTGLDMMERQLLASEPGRVRNDRG